MGSDYVVCVAQTVFTLAILLLQPSCKRTSVRGNKMAEMSLGTNGNPGDVKGQMTYITLF
jgi:hypothetical protein